MQPNVIFIDSILSSVYKSKLLKQVITPVIMQSHTGLVGLNLNKSCEITSAIICQFWRYMKKFGNKCIKFGKHFLFV